MTFQMTFGMSYSGSAASDPESLVDLVLAGPPRLGAVRLITIDGPSGSGKSTLGVRLRNALAARGRRVCLVPTDHFATWDDPTGWWPELESGVLVPFAADRPARYVALEWIGGTPARTRPITVPVPEVLILEGVSAARQAIEERATVSVWVEHASPADRLERVVARDGEPVREPMGHWQRAEQEWFAADRTAERAQVTVRSGGTSFSAPAS